MLLNLRFINFFQCLRLCFIKFLKKVAQFALAFYRFYFSFLRFSNFIFYLPIKIFGCAYALNFLFARPPLSILTANEELNFVKKSANFIQV